MDLVEITEEEWAAMEAGRCKVMRGKRSKIRCEKREATEHDAEHAGRGSGGRWFFWSTKEELCGEIDPIWDRECSWVKGHTPIGLHQDDTVKGDRITWGLAHLVRAYERGEI